MKYKILMALMGLEIGGAETHVVELSKELHKQGYDIVIASNGGVYEKELTDMGIKHYQVPMNRRNVFRIIESYFLLKEIIVKENIDIVHSHARIPGFICGLLHKKMNFTFVTSAHWVFYTGMGLKYLTNWGQKVVAVSDDIKEYLMKNYGVRKKDIFVTINGIDTDKFSPTVTGDRIREEFGLMPNAPTISYVSRMDEDRALVARQLIAIAERLCNSIPRLQIVIAGGGNVFQELQEKANQVNSKLSRNCIIMTGSRTDINEIVAVGDLFVGVSRAALEAMAAAKPVIVAGNEGYIGLFGQEKLAISQETNFCCRGCNLSSEEQLYQDIITGLTKLSEEERQAVGRYGRQVIFDYYSVSKMAGDCVTAYEAAYKQSHSKQYHVLMSGYYGFNNSGDEAILLAMHRNIEALGDNINITILSNKPEETQSKYGIDGVVYRFSLWQVVKALRKCDVLLSGGGSLLQDSTSTRSLLYYLSIIVGARMFGKKVMLYANGIGPVSKNSNRHLVKMVVNKADLITLREGNSYEELRSMGVNNPEAYVTADPVFTMDGISKDGAKRLMEKNGIPVDKPLAGISVRNWRGMEERASEFAAFCDAIYETYGKNIVFIVMQVPDDVNISLKVQAKMKNPSYILKENYSPYEIMGIISVMEFIVSMRLHTLIFAARQKIPFIGLIYDPKVEFYLKLLDMPSAGSIEEFSATQALAVVENVISNIGSYHALLETSSQALAAKAHQNEEYLMRLLEGQ